MITSGCVDRCFVRGRALWVVLAVCLVAALPGYGQSPAASCGNCPGDLNGDLTVNLQDFAIVASNWLEVCDGKLPVLVVTGNGLSGEQAAALAQNLGISDRLVVSEDGSVRFIDPVSFQAVPTKQITDQALIAVLQRESADNDGPLSFEGFDFAALAQVRPFDPKQALEQFQGALRQVGGLGEGAMPQIDHTQFEATDTKGNLLLPAVNLDTRVSFNFEAAGVPLTGPGAQVSATFDPSGKVSQLIHSARSYGPGEPVAIISPEEAALRCAELYPGLRVQVRPRLVYYAPSLSLRNVQVLVPCYECGGTVRSGKAGVSNLMDMIIPATDNGQYVPHVSLEVSVLRNVVTANAAVEGGAGPYTYQWFSSSTALGEYPADAESIEYIAEAREPGSYPETVKVLVTDENGVVAQAVQTVMVVITQGSGVAAVKSTGADFGVERAVSDLGAQEQNGYINRMDDEVIKRFNWTGASSWERDFKDTETWATGLDHAYVDSVDQAFYVGHGSGAGITFESNYDDADLVYTDVPGAWGDGDLEWMVVLSCQVLKAQHDGKSWAQRWGPAFDGLHLLLGYQTNAAANTDVAKRFAEYQLGRNFGFVTITLPIRAAWCQAKKEQQPNDREAVVMGVIGPDGLSNYNDYFWSKGPVGPDLRGSNIRGYWRLVYK